MTSKQLKLIERKDIKFEASKLFLNALLEERGISRSIQSDANEFISLIQDFISSSKIEYNEYGFLEKYDLFESNVNDKKINIHLHEYYFKNNNTYNKYKNIINYFYQYNNHNKTVYLTVVIIDGFMLPNTSQTKMAHELMHRLQYDKTGKELLYTEKYYNNIKGLTSEQNDIVRAIKNIIYLSSHFEQEAYSNELYNELWFLQPKNYLDVLNKCNSYIAYKQFESDVNKIDSIKNEEFVIALLNDYGYTVNYFVKQAKIALNKFARKLGKAISLFIDDSKTIH